MAKSEKSGGKESKPKKDKATSGGGKDSNSGGAPSKKAVQGGKGDTTGSRGTSGQ